jgi:hypothetical protein
MSGFPDSMESNILDHFFGGVALSPSSPANIHVGLYTTLPADDETGGVEASYTGYGRVSVTNNSTEWPAATEGAPTSKSNANTITFGQKTDAGDVTIVGFGLFDASSGGNLLFFGAVTPNQTVGQNDTPRFLGGDIVIELGDPGDSYS